MLPKISVSPQSEEINFEKSLRNNQSFEKMDGQLQQHGNLNSVLPTGDSTRKEKPKVPVPIIILAILMLLGGVSSIAYFIFFLATGLLTFPWLTGIGLFIFSAILITAAWGLRDMKKWGLYFVVLWSILSVLFSVYSIAVSHTVSLYSLIFIPVNGLVAGYLIYIRNKFEPEKTHQPVLIASIATSVLVLFVIGTLLDQSLVQSQEKNLQTMKTNALDSSVETNVSHEAIALMDYDIQNDTYKGFSIDAKDIKDWNDTLGAYCKTSLKIDISPDGKKFIIHQPLCSDPQKSACFEDDMSDAVIVDTAKVEKNYSCK